MTLNLLSFSFSLFPSPAVRVGQLTVDTSKDFSGSCPSSPRSKHQTLPTGSVSPHHQPIIHRTSLQHPTPSSQMRAKQRSWSDLRSPSPQKPLLPSFSKSEREKASMCVCLPQSSCMHEALVWLPPQYQVRMWFGVHLQLVFPSSVLCQTALWLHAVFKYHDHTCWDSGP